MDRFDTTSGLYNFRNRDYSPTLGRWMEQDPVGYAAGDSNLYGFVQGNPANSTDPTGNDKIGIYSRPTEGVGINIFGIIYTPHWFVGVIKDDGTIVTYSWTGSWSKSDKIYDIPYVDWWHGVGKIVVSPKVTSNDVEKAYQQIRDDVAPNQYMRSRML